MSPLPPNVLLALLAAVALGAPKAKTLEQRFLDERVSEMSKEGYSVKRKLIAPSSDQGKLAVYVFQDGKKEFERLKVWHMKGRVARQIYIEVDLSFKITLERIHDKGKLPDLYGDGSRVLAYRTRQARGSQLRIVRFRGSTPELEETPLPDGWMEDLDRDGRPEILSRSLPLGSLYSFECRGFHGMIRTAYRTQIFEIKDGRLTPASSRHPEWFAEHIAKLEGDIAAMDPRSTERYGEFVSTALSIYFDHAERGAPYQGWRRFNELISPSAGDPPGTSDCIRQMKADLRRRLNVPDSWQ